MDSWSNLIYRVLKLPVHQDIAVSKSAILSPLEEGFIESIGDFKGQVADFRRPMPDGRSIHVREFKKHFLVHWDFRDPSLDPLGHLVQDAPHILGLLSLAALVVLGLAVEFGGEK